VEPGQTFAPGFQDAEMIFSLSDGGSCAVDGGGDSCAWYSSSDSKSSSESKRVSLEAERLANRTGARFLTFCLLDQNLATATQVRAQHNKMTASTARRCQGGPSSLSWSSSSTCSTRLVELVVIVLIRLLDRLRRAMVTDSLVIVVPGP